MTARATRPFSLPLGLVLALASCGTDSSGGLPPSGVAGAPATGGAASGGSGGQPSAISGTSGTTQSTSPPSGTGAGQAGAAAGQAGSGGTLSGPPDAIIDAHTHFWDLNQNPGFSNGQTVLPADYEKLARPAGIGGTLLVEAVWRNVDENLWGITLAENNPIVVGVIGRLSLGEASFAQDLDALAAHALFRGLRIQPEELAVPSAKLVEAKGLVVEIDAAGSADAVLKVATNAPLVPTLKIVLDHAANLSFAGNPSGALAEALKVAAGAANVYCKVSRLQEQAGATPAPKDPLAYAQTLDFLLATFGEDRLIFGSNWPLSEGAGSLQDATQIVRTHFEAKSHELAQKVLHRNAEAAYGVALR